MPEPAKKQLIKKSVKSLQSFKSVIQTIKESMTENPAITPIIKIKLITFQKKESLNPIIQKILIQIIFSLHNKEF